MSRRKLIGLFSLLISLVHAAAADEAVEPASGNGPTNPPPALKASVRGDDSVGGRTIHHAYVNYGTNRFSFVVPEGCHVDGSSSEKLVVVNEGYDCFIGFRVVGLRPAGIPTLNVDHCRELLLSRYPKAEITEEYSRSVASHEGAVFDFRWRNSSGTVQSGRVIFVPMSAGFVEFSLVTTEEKTSAGQELFHRFLLTFRTDESGKLEVVHFAENV